MAVPVVTVSTHLSCRCGQIDKWGPLLAIFVRTGVSLSDTTVTGVDQLVCPSVAPLDTSFGCVTGFHRGVVASLVHFWIS